MKTISFVAALILAVTLAAAAPASPPKTANTITLRFTVLQRDNILASKTVPADNNIQVQAREAQGCVGCFLEKPPPEQGNGGDMGRSPGGK
ncbi:uncharacterized protein BP5553_06369 [Venustampulla echinocandica]|uniref:Uncharacterized protein n=1 Tax=Venustampulla echinocandica TaxID=2656787 RepID=A0A370TJR3_9HELO|nr:uncharacterized protein BP5553_06369 [Venustampulla echinocandica]RDL35757.1 hypothetical protein BP5553_06369 [Venustampulla echinocandica]